MQKPIYKAVFVCLLLAVLVGSLLPISHPSVSPNDKVNHFTAYAILMISGALAFQSKFRIALFVIGWGIMIELLQGLTDYRQYDIADALANSAGVLLGFVAMVIWQRFQQIIAVRNRQPNNK